MPNVKIRSIRSENRWGELNEATIVEIDGQRVADGTYGGEPEDNMRLRDYHWVETALVTLARKLGAEVTFVTEEVDDDQYEEILYG